jgi:hypothetical protein
VVDAGEAVELEVRDVVTVADRADDGVQLAARDVRLRPTCSTWRTIASTWSAVADSFMTIIIWT